MRIHIERDLTESSVKDLHGNLVVGRLYSWYMKTFDGRNVCQGMGKFLSPGKAEDNAIQAIADMQGANDDYEVILNWFKGEAVESEGEA